MGDETNPFAPREKPSQSPASVALTFCRGFSPEALNGSSLGEVVAAAQKVLDNGDFPTHAQQYAANDLADLLDRLQSTKP